MFKRGFSFAPGYRLEQFLGRGQFGQVWRATAPGGTSAAIKFIDLSGGEGAKEHEGIRRVKQIRHANLMPITAIWLLDAEGQAMEESAPDIATETIDFGPFLGDTAQWDKPTVADPGATRAFSGNVGDGDSPQRSPAGSPARSQVADEASWLAVAMLLGGASLQQRLRECVREGLGGIPPRELISYMDESAKGLDFLNQPRHDLGDGPVAIQHCDVKPANIVLIGSSAVVCDFGLARILSRNQITATSASGTPAYMAPEAIEGKPSRTSDQYSLAVTYYHLRTGTLPIGEGTLWEVLDAHRRGKLDLSRLPEHEQAALRRATSLDWEGRFESNQDMVEALREALRLEGHTRPIALPSVAGGTAPGTQAATPTVSVAGETGLESGTQPTAGIQATETLVGDAQRPASEPPDVEKSVAAVSGDVLPPAEPLAPPWWKRPRVAATAAVPTAVLLVLLLQLMNRGTTVTPDPEVDVVRGTAPEDPGDPKPIESADALFEQALADARFDFPEAVTAFRRAVGLDPSLLEVRPQFLAGHSGGVHRLIFSSDGEYLISVADDAAEFVWPIGATDGKGLANLRPILRSTEPGELLEAVSVHRGKSANFTGTGATPDLLAVGGTAAELTLTRLESKPQSEHRLIPDQDVVSLAWHPDGRHLVAATLTPSIVIVDTQLPADSGDAVWKFDIRDAIDSVAIDPLGRWLLILGDDGGVLRIAWEEVESLRRVPGSPTPERFTGEGTHVRVMHPMMVQSGTADGLGSALVTGGDDGEVTVWPLSGEDSQPKRPVVHLAQVESLAVAHTPEGVLIISGSGDGKIAFIADGRVRQVHGHRREIGTLATSENGDLLVAGSYDGDITVWDLSAWSESQDGSADPPMMRLSPDDAGVVHSVAVDEVNGRIAAGHDDGVITVWDLWHVRLISAASPPSSGSQRPKPDPPKPAPTRPASPGRAT